VTTGVSTTGWRGKIDALIPPSMRETLYRVVAGASTFLIAFGLVNHSEAVLWAQLGTSLVTLLFALLYTTVVWRAALYGVVGPLGAILMAYGIVNDVRWALITAAVGQVFGVATAAAKAVQPDVPVGR